MRFNRFFLILLIPALLLARTSFAQFNLKPLITGQIPSPLNTDENVAVTIQINNLIIVDLNDLDHSDFKIKLYEGNNYTFQGTTVVPDKDFDGTLTVPLSVNDGKDESNKFDFRIRVNEVENIRPVITGQVALSTTKGQEITIELTDLTVTDADNKYPDDFTLKVFDGSNYSIKGNTVIPGGGFVGTLTVQVSVKDGEDESIKYPLKITVTERPNVVPIITGQDALSLNEDQSITLSLGSLEVTDPDNDYPKDFTLKIYEGNNYSFTGNKITPLANYSGTLTVNVSVNDSKDESAIFPLQVLVRAVNDAPLITAQIPLTTFINTPITINFSDLSVTDPDNIYPTDFTLTVQQGNNYTVTGTTVTPAPNFTGTLPVRVFVNDGKANSNVYSLQVSVIPVTARPQIIGQESLIINEDESITLRLTDLEVSDADDVYPTGFTLQILSDPENKYRVDKLVVTPAKDLNGFLTVLVTVTDNDGNESERFNLAILINAINDAPMITQLETEAISYEPGTEPAAISATIEVNDVDNDHLSFAEITFDENYTKGADELQFINSGNIRGIFDVDGGKLSLVGYATLPEYTEALRSVKYHYQLPDDDGGPGANILPQNKKVLITVHDGQQQSEYKIRSISMETEVLLNIPTAFTPNGDEPNETWNIRALSNEDQCDAAIIRVYNKRGLLLFQSVGLEKNWDGTYNGDILPMDVYYFTIDLNLSYAKKSYKGTVTILR